ncbi:YpoC family protein [Neobacillus niacini]|uniref:YpoC family protein n=1 Tax=Neobacillus niacini TaxID=86668 RepID=UPI0021CB1982|nr:hypothetical protein [Neobacillus niacini]MCM3766599.1 hypothetical protein [Neobacillus niacini]
MESKLAVSNLLEEWKTVKIRLENNFRERNQQGTKELMEQGITLFIHFLHLTNESTAIEGEPVPFGQFHFKPVNIEERLGFIQARPNLFHSFRQLSELMVEQEKQYVKKTIIKKSSRHDA